MPKDKQMFLMDGFEVFCSNIQSYRVRKANRDFKIHVYAKQQT